MIDHKFSDNILTSKDGTIISYKTIGTGTPLIIIPGALSTSEDFEQLAKELADDFEVNIFERRGRGKSGNMGQNYSIQTEIEDLNVIQEKTKAKYLYGHSYGGLIALEYAQQNDIISKIAVYEPGVSVNNSISVKWGEAYTKYLNAKKPMEAFIEFIIGSGGAPKLPKWYFKIILKIVLGEKKLSKTFPLLPQNLLEHQQIALLNDTYRNYENLNAKVLLLTGGKTSKSIAKTMEFLRRNLKNINYHLFKNLDHFGSMEKGQKEVAIQLKTYFLS